MKKKNLLIASLLTLVVVGAVVMAQTDMLQGRFGKKWDFSKIYLHRGLYVTLIASPVTSVHTSDLTSDVSSEVTSKVTSSGGTSEVASTVTSKVTSTVASGVTSAVASAVAVPADIALKAKSYSIKTLTKTILENFAKTEYKKNPSAFVLSAEQMKKLLDMYEKNSAK